MNIRSFIDSSLVIAVIAVSVAWGVAQAERKELQKKVSKLESVVVEQAITNTKIESIEKHQEEIVDMLREQRSLVRSLISKGNDK